MDRMVKRIIAAAERAVEQCPCTIARRDSGHQVECYAPELDAAITEYKTTREAILKKARTATNG